MPSDNDAEQVQQVQQAPGGQAQIGQNEDRRFRPQVRAPTTLSLKENKTESFRLFKKRWNNYMLLSNLTFQDRAFQVAQLENCLDDDALKTLEGQQFATAVENRTVPEIIEALDRYAIGEVHETYERFVFGQRNQEEGEKI
jgi:hypothetical protein